MLNSVYELGALGTELRISIQSTQGLCNSGQSHQLYKCREAAICINGTFRRGKDFAGISLQRSLTLFNHNKEVKLGWFTYLLLLQSLGSQIGCKTFCKCQPQTLSRLRVGYLFYQAFLLPTFKERAHKPCKHFIERRLRVCKEIKTQSWFLTPSQDNIKYAYAKGLWKES